MRNKFGCWLSFWHKTHVSNEQVSDGWPVFVMPYLNPIHASAITCITQVSDVTPGIIERIAEVGKNDLAGKISARDWPISGGALSDEGQKAEAGRDILLTGHEDGSVKLWTCSGVALAPLATVKTNKFFVGDELDEPRGTNQLIKIVFRSFLTLLLLYNGAWRKIILPNKFTLHSSKVSGLLFYSETWNIPALLKNAIQVYFSVPGHVYLSLIWTLLMTRAVNYELKLLQNLS